MLIQRLADIAPSEITSPALFASRREFIKAASLGTIAGALGIAGTPAIAEPAGGLRGQKLEGIVKGRFSTDEKLTLLLG